MLDVDRHRSTSYNYIGNGLKRTKLFRLPPHSTLETAALKGDR